MDKELLLAPVNSLGLPHGSNAFYFLSCSSRVALGAGRHQSLGPFPRAPLSPMAHSGFRGGALDPKEGNTYLQETLSLTGNVEIRGIK